MTTVETRSPQELFDQYAAYATAVANNYIYRTALERRRFFPGEIRQAALIGLWNAAQRFRNDKGASFKRNWICGGVIGAG